MRVSAVASLLALLLSSSSFAQGLSDARGMTILPNPQAGGVDDATSLLVNPAGLGAVRGLELQAGWFGRNNDGVMAHL
ncbi:MAG TPA: hypothetical protein VGF99_00055, partial [Myxococcota bacterium]